MIRRFLTVATEGRTYQIPEMWIAGFCHAGATVAQAVQHWHEQEMMEGAHG